MDPFGYTGEVLRVDLENEKITIEKPGEPHYKRYLGGRGMIMHTLLTEVPPHTDPFGPENRLVFAAGPLTGHKLVGTGRVSVGSKSPLTGGCGESEAGGPWGAELRRAGYDGIIIEGVARKPVYLWINDRRVEIRDAGRIWGSEIRHAMEWIRGDIGEKRARTALIGPGGENRVRYANIIIDCRHAFGRTGMGAVMGAKRLKGVVIKGSGFPSAADRDKILALNRLMKERYKSSPLAKHGTGAGMKGFEAVGNLPIRNYSGGYFPNVEKIDAMMLLREHGTGLDGCFNCPIRCKKRVLFEGGPWEIDGSYGGAEYETLASFGSNLLIDDLQAISKANEICNSHGLDTISTGASIAFAMECFENDLLTREDTDGLRLNFGNAEAMVTLVKKIALREGVGDLLSKGSKKAAEIIGKGALNFAMQVKGLEIPYHEPRLNQGIGIHYSIHGTGADHVSGMIDGRLAAMLDEWESLNSSEMLSTTELSPRKARMVYELGIWRAMPNYLGLCSFVPWRFAEIRDAVEAVTGWKVTTWKLMKAVERGMTMMRVFNIREGFTRKDDTLPDRFFTSPREGPLKGVKIDPAAFQKAQESYYQMMGWDKEGVPTRGCLEALDLEWAVPYLRK